MRNTGVKNGAGLGKTLLVIIAAGVAGGATLIGGAKKLGEKITEKHVSKYEAIEKQREADKEEARRIMAAEEGGVFEEARDEDVSEEAAEDSAE